ncbi:pimeloyl-ACP methyl ester esterase BioH [Celerinatantimonas sp. YJH-8]|uniref:pimeloyl-ACP methyl ester esterase BioH n=1 Tax=Celerinatantimonas sp. YJH-8 TaxID=3228714 RepID=UPI0038C6AA4B
MTLHVEQRGSGPNLILLHGWGMNSAIWESVANRLAERFSLYLVDLPGYGLSQPAELITFDETCEQLSRILPEGIWLGWSMGGLLALQIALRCPSQVSKLITVASTATFVERKQWPGIKPDVLAFFAQGLTQDYRKTLDRFLAIQTLGSPRAKADIQQIRHQLQQRPEPALTHLNQGIEWLKTIDLRSGLSSLQVPWLQIFGALDSLVPKQAMPAHLQYRNIQQQLIAKASHAPFISHPREFVESIENFLFS